MYKADISFNTKEWLCKQCGLFKDISSIHLKIGDNVYFSIYKTKNDFGSISQEIYGTILDIQGNDLIILEKSNIKTYSINKTEVYPNGRPAFFLYNMYGKCMCKK